MPRRKRKPENPYQGQLNIGTGRSYYQPPLHALPDVQWSPPTPAELPSWANASTISVDVETKDEDIKALGPGVRRADSYVCGVSFAIDDGPAFYLPICHDGGDNCKFDVWAYLRDQFKAFNGVLTGANLGYDLDWLVENGCDVLGLGIRDVQVIAPLLYELHTQYNLDVLCKRNGLPGKDETLLRRAAELYRVNPKSQLWRLPARFVARYAMVDARRPLQLLPLQEKRLDQENTHQIWELERQVTPILVKMRRRGVRIDVKQLAHIEALALRKQARYLDEVHHLTGVRIKVGDVNRAAVLAPVVQHAGIAIPRTKPSKAFKNGKMSIKNELLEKCGPAGHALIRARKWEHLQASFCASIRRYMVRGRIHCTFNQLRMNDDRMADDRAAGKGGGRGVRFGRFSSTDPNLQQQPTRDPEFGVMWRKIYIPDEGARWACGDWSQQEPRVAVHMGELVHKREKAVLPGVVEFADAYRANPNLDIHQALTDIANEMGAGLDRGTVKQFVNGRLYGMGDPKLCRSLRMSVVMGEKWGRRQEVPGPDCQSVIDRFSQFAPWIAGLTRYATGLAKRRGYVRTMLGRVLHFERDKSGKYQFTHKAMNRVGQGSAADQMKATLVAADREGIPIQLAVHDEFDFSFDDIAVARRLKKLQEETVKFNVPMKVDLEIGPSWGELAKDTDV